MELKRPNEDLEPHWSGWARDKSLLPLKALERDGYVLEEREDFHGKYWQIVRGLEQAK